MKNQEKIMEIINVFDTAGVYAITSDMIKDYCYDRKLAITSSQVEEMLDELAAQDRIVWDETRSYFRPVQY